MSLLDNNIDQQFEKSLTFLLYKWSLLDGPYILGSSQRTFSGKPIADNLKPNRLYFSATPLGVWMGTIEDGFELFTYEQYLEYNRCRSLIIKKKS